MTSILHEYTPEEEAAIREMAALSGASVRLPTAVTAELKSIEADWFIEGGELSLQIWEHGDFDFPLDAKTQTLSALGSGVHVDLISGVCRHSDPPKTSRRSIFVSVKPAMPPSAAMADMYAAKLDFAFSNEQ